MAKQAARFVPVLYPGSGNELGPEVACAAHHPLPQVIIGPSVENTVSGLFLSIFGLFLPKIRLSAIPTIAWPERRSPVVRMAGGSADGTC